MPPHHDDARSGRAAEQGGGTEDLAWLVINLDRCPDRFDAVAARGAALGLRITRIAASEGRSLPLPLPGIDADLYRRTHGRILLPGEVGCFVSHLRALRHFLSTPQAFAMVLEDDVLLTPAAVDLARHLVAPGATDDWDLVKFEAHHGRAGLTLRRISARHRLCVLPFKAAGSAAYLVNRIGAERLLGRLLPMRFPYDIAFDRSWETGLRVRAILPPPIATTGAPSTIARTGEAAARKRQPVAIRIETHVMRVVAACRAWGFPARRFDRADASGTPRGRSLADAVEAAITRPGRAPAGATER